MELWPFLGHREAEFHRFHQFLLHGVARSFAGRLSHVLCREISSYGQSQLLGRFGHSCEPGARPSGLRYMCARYMPLPQIMPT